MLQSNSDFKICLCKANFFLENIANIMLFLQIRVLGSAVSDISNVSGRLADPSNITGSLGEDASSTSTGGCIFADKTETLELYISIPLPIRVSTSFCAQLHDLPLLTLQPEIERKSGLWVLFSSPTSIVHFELVLYPPRERTYSFIFENYFPKHGLSPFMERTRRASINHVSPQASKQKDFLAIISDKRILSASATLLPSPTGIEIETGRQSTMNGLSCAKMRSHGDRIMSKCKRKWSTKEKKSGGTVLCRRKIGRHIRSWFHCSGSNSLSLLFLTYCLGFLPMQQDYAIMRNAASSVSPILSGPVCGVCLICLKKICEPERKAVLNTITLIKRVKQKDKWI
ncbi:hypothetical protein EAG_14424 [Camponotus floridanus]|uniref:Uncharacterized protein n=1 Tax=Camponotus floridanus TaxID=104421 RepID=E2A4Z8_CAMFO|nr:hypothetical protein EAG_14424 [Camponotus floridanus]